MILAGMSSDPSSSSSSSSAPAPGWPALGSTDVPWTPTIPAELVSRSVRERHRGPYRASVVPVIADLIVPVRPADLALAEEAAHEIGRFDVEVGAEVAPFATVLLRTESASSSQIEHITTGARELAVAALGGPGNRRQRNAALVVNNVAAMRAAIDLSGQLDLSSVLAIHEALLRESEPAIAGRLRDQQVWVGGSSFGPHEATFVPPVHADVPGLLDDLFRFGGRSDLPALVQAAVAHAQFETIHPFVDGNGRTGRAVIHALLRRRELTRAVTVPVSAGLLSAVGDYFGALTTYRDGDPSPMVAVLATGALTAITDARQLVADLHEVRSRWADVVKARRDAATWRVADLLLRQPVVDAAAVSRELDVAPANALRPLQPLIDAGVLTEFTGAARNRLWQSAEVLSALDDFAARAGRRATAQG